MKLKWLAEIFAFIISATSTVPLEGMPPSKPFVQEVETSYNEGVYDDFLRQLDEQYRKAGKVGALRNIFETAKKSMKNKDPALKTINPDQFKKQSQERNKHLLEAIADHPDLEIVQKIDQVVFSEPTAKQEKILTDLDSLKYELPENTRPTLKNKISALETEYYLKSLLLDVGNHKSQSPTFELKKKKMVLSFEKFDKMQEIVSDFSDPIWEEKIAIAKDAFRVQSAYRDCLSDLEALALDLTIPKNSVEEKVKQIMMEYSTLH